MELDLATSLLNFAAAALVLAPMAIGFFKKHFEYVQAPIVQDLICSAAALCVVCPQQSEIGAAHG
jgi:hypothetical protein